MAEPAWDEQQFEAQAAYLRTRAVELLAVIADKDWVVRAALASTPAPPTVETLPTLLAAQQALDALPTSSELVDLFRTVLLDTALHWAAAHELELLRMLVQQLPALHELAPSILDKIPLWADPNHFAFLLPSTSTTYYQTRIEQTSEAGLIDVALSLTQIAASKGIPHLDSLGEELSLLHKLVYDRSLAATSKEPLLTLSHWRSLAPEDIIRLYLARSGPLELCGDIKRLVLPYLYVLESQAERAGAPDPDLHTRLLYSYILSLSSAPLPVSPSAVDPLDLLASIFQGSKPTLSKGTRIIKDDIDLAKIAIASLYGCARIDEKSFSLRGDIFECLPAFEESQLGETGGGNLFEQFPFGSSVSPDALFATLAPFSPSSLSAALDALDLHLATAETFSRYLVPVTLSWFLTSHHDESEQRRTVERVCRDAQRDMEEEEGLLEDLTGLGEEEEEGAELMRKAFWRVGRDDVLRILFAEMLAASKFSLAKSLFRTTTGSPLLPSDTVESLVIEASNDYFEKASEGNLHKGDMKLAFECLSVASSSAAIVSARDLIEAVSRLYTFPISTPSSPLRPSSILHSTNRLEYISLLLSASPKIYKHPQVIFELVHMLGYDPKDVLVEIKARGMILESALLLRDFPAAEAEAGRGFETALSMRKGKGKAHAGEAGEVVWRGCWALGRHAGWTREGRMRVLGMALILCPKGELEMILRAWNVLDGSADYEVEREDTPLRSAITSPTLAMSDFSFSPTVTASGRLSSVGTPVLGSAEEPGSARGSGAPGRTRESGDGGGLSAGISSRLTKGVGWLIGAPDE